MRSDISTSPAFGHWNKALQLACGPFTSKPSRQSSLFIGDIHRQDFGSLEVARIRTNVELITRQGTGSADDHQICFLIFQRSGRQCIRQENNSLELIEGDLALVDSTNALEIQPHGLIENISIHLPRDVVERKLGKQSFFAKLSRTSVSTQMIRTMIDFIDNSPVCKGIKHVPDDGDALQTALLALLPTALIDRQQIDVNNTELEQSDLYGFALRLIDEQLHEAFLSPTYLAQQMNLSLRRLYRLFEEQGETVSRYIQRQRLVKVAEDLSRPEMNHESITRIAFKWGFSDVAHFSRAFKRYFERGPRSYRARASNC